MSETEAIRRQWAREQAADFGREALGFTGYDGYYDAEAAYEYARLAGHFGLIALGYVQHPQTRMRDARRAKGQCHRCAKKLIGDDAGYAKCRSCRVKAMNQERSRRARELLGA